jgi:hypothetical protein
VYIVFSIKNGILKWKFWKYLNQKNQWLAKNVSHQLHYKIKQHKIKLKTKNIYIIHDRFCIANQIYFNKNDMQDITAKNKYKS